MEEDFLNKRIDSDFEDIGNEVTNSTNDTNIDGIHSRRRARNSEGSRDYVCGCSKAYLSYPALYTHVRNKHDNVMPIGTKIPNRRHSDKPVMIKPATNKYTTGLRLPTIMPDLQIKGPWSDFIMIKRRCRLTVEHLTVTECLRIEQRTYCR